MCIRDRARARARVRVRVRVRVSPKPNPHLTPTLTLTLIKGVDKFNDYFISAFVTAGQIRCMLLHDVRNEDGIRNFFHDVHELYVKVLMNPFYDVNLPISSALFDARVKVLGRKYF